LKLASWILILILLIGCTKTLPTKTPYNENFTTEQIRNLWLICSQNFQYRHPLMNEFSRWSICDCYTDTIRSKYEPDQILQMNKIDARELTNLLVTTCNPEIKLLNPT